MLICQCSFPAQEPFIVFSPLPSWGREMMDQLWWIPGMQTGPSHHKDFLCICDIPIEKLRAMSNCGKWYWHPIVFSRRFTARLAHFSLDVHYGFMMLWNELSLTQPNQFCGVQGLCYSPWSAIGQPSNELWIGPLSKSVFLDCLGMSFIFDTLHLSCLPWLCWLLHLKQKSPLTCFAVVTRELRVTKPGTELHMGRPY